MARRQQELACLDVVADLEHVLTGSDGTHHLDSRVIDHLGVFDHDHGVRAVREHSAGVYLGNIAAGQSQAGRPAHRYLSNHVQIGRNALGCAVGVSRYDCVSVHCGAREGWKRSGDMYIRSRHAPQGQVRFDILTVDPVADVGA